MRTILIGASLYTVYHGSKTVAAFGAIVAGQQTNGNSAARGLFRFFLGQVTGLLVPDFRLVPPTLPIFFRIHNLSSLSKPMKETERALRLFRGILRTFPAGPFFVSIY